MGLIVDCRVPVIRPTMSEPGGNFQIKVFRCSENGIFILVFVNTVSHERAIVLIF